MASGGKFGPKTINPGSGRLTQLHNKGSREQLLPGRHAMETLTKGDPWQRSMGNYAKLTPSGANAPLHYQDIIDMGQMGTKVDNTE
jgi:hypothetical protein